MGWMSWGERAGHRVQGGFTLVRAAPLDQNRSLIGLTGAGYLPPVRVEAAVTELGPLARLDRRG